MSKTPIRDGFGRVIGYKGSDGTYYDVKGQVVARVRGESTYDSRGQVQGKGDQGMRLLGK